MTKLFLNSPAPLYEDESGQWLLEYLLILAVVALAAAAGMQSVASSISRAFSKIGTKLGQYISSIVRNRQTAKT